MTSRIATQRINDATIAALAWAAVSAGIVLGGKPLWVALIALAIPMVAFVAFSHLAGRGAVMACVASALGVGMASTSPGASAWGAIGLIGLIDLAALVGGLTAERMAPAVEVGRGTWMTIVVQHEAVASDASPRLVPLVASSPLTVGPMDRTRRTPRARRKMPLDRTA